MVFDELDSPNWTYHLPITVDYVARISDEVYFIVADKCTECNCFHYDPLCASVFPVDCFFPDYFNVDSEEVFL